MTFAAKTAIIRLLLFAHLLALCCGQEALVVNLRPANISLPQGEVLHTFQNLSVYSILHGKSCPQDTIGIGGTEGRSVILQRTVTFGEITSFEPLCVDTAAGTLTIQSYHCFITIDGLLGIQLIINVEPTLFASGIMFPATFYRGAVVEGMESAIVKLLPVPEILPQTLPIPSLLVFNYRIAGNGTQLFRAYKQQNGCLSYPIIETIGNLDRELESLYELTLETYAEHAPTRLFASTIIQINILDQNDNPPVINNLNRFPHIEVERVFPGLNVTQFKATDADNASNEVILFTFLNVNIYLTVHPLNGVIFFYRSLYLQTPVNISFDLVVHNMGRRTQSSTYPVTASVSNININTADRSPPHITINGLGQGNTISISERAALGDHVITVNIAHQDFTGLTLQMANLGPCNCFNLSNPQLTSSGQQFNVSVAAELDYEAALNGQYQISLVASDVDTLSSTVEVSVLIIDENEAPSFMSETYHIRAEEGVPIGTSVGRVQATDPDSGINGALAYTILSQSPMNLLEVHRPSGTIYTIADLDYLQVQSVQVLIQAEDTGGLLTSTLIVLTLVDRNDNAPVFIPSSVDASVSLMETNNPDHVIFQFVAVDADLDCNQALEFSILHAEPDVFYIDPVSGLLYPQDAKSLDFEKFKFALVIVRVADLGKTVKFYTETTLQIQLVGVDDEIPIIDPPDCPCFIMENVSPTSPGTSCSPLSAHDLDSETLTYSMSSTPLTALPFQIDPNTGVVSISSSLDREEQEIYRLSIMVTDGLHVSAPITLTVVVVDVNDNGPIYYQGNSLTLSAPSDLSPGDFVADCSARDSDVGYNSISNYKFASGTLSYVYETFSIDYLSGMLYTRKQLERFEYTFSVLVFDPLAREYDTILNVTINVRGLKNNPPRFQLSIDHRTIPEDLSTESVITTIVASDTDSGENGQLTYSVVESSSNHSGLFSLQGNGNLKLMQSISGRAGNIYILNVSTSDNGNPILMDHQLLVVSIYPRTITLGLQSLVYNPSIPVHHYSGSIIEGSNMVESVVQLPGMRDLRNLQFIILEGKGPTAAFYINQSSSTLQTKSGFQNAFNNTEAVFITLIAQYIPNFFLCSVTVNIVDINNNPPVFSLNTYSFTIYNSTQVGYSVYRIITADADVGANARVVYGITDSNLFPFEIDNKTGVIMVSELLSTDVYQFTVTAVDPGLPFITATATVIAIVLGTSNHIPVFSPFFELIVIPETAQPRRIVQQMIISDLDDSLGSHGMNSFCIASGNLHSLFSITAEGILIVNELDYESYPININLTIMAYDKSLNPTFILTGVRVQVRDENEMPIFSVPVYRATLSEGEVIGTHITNVKAVDRDAGINGMVTYSVPNNIEFSVDIVTGSIVSSVVFDRERNGDVITFYVTATDGGSPPLLSYAEVHVTILDVNDNNPIFSHENSIGNVPEDVGIGFEVTKISATDFDIGANGIVRYTIVSGNDDRKFSLDPFTGSLRILQELNFQVPPTSYSLTVQAFDLGSPSLTSLETFLYVVMVMDSNDNFPVFSSVEYECELEENANQFSTLCKVSATDADNTSITYSLVDISKMFQINPSSGVITPNTQIPAQDRMGDDPAYILHVMATDSDTEPKISSAILRVKIIGNNHVPFRTNQENSSYFFHESIPVNSLLFFAHFHDLDEISPVLYELESQSSYFSVDRETGAVFLHGILDYDIMNSPIVFRIIASNYGESISEYTINILDVNENQLPPVFDPNDPVIVSLPRSSPLGSSVINLNAIDPNEGDSITYAITGGTGVGYFWINTSTGEITTSFSLTSVEAALLTVQIRAVNQRGSLSLQSWHKVVISLTQGILSKPVFKYPVFLITLAENIHQVIYVVRAEIDGKSDTSIRYAISSGNDDNIFSINSQTGAISLTTSADPDREVKPLYNFTVTASKPGTPGTSIALIVVNLQGINDTMPLFIRNNFRPSFDSDKYTFEISEAYLIPNLAVGRVGATDLDSNPITNLTFSIEDSSIPNLFTVEASSGIIRLSNQTSEINRESLPSHTLTVSVSDNGNPPLLDFVSVTVIVTDSDDNVPSFHPSSLDIFVPEDAPIGYVVHTISAFDPDLGSNATIHFELVTTRVPFLLNTTTGSLSLATCLDAESQPVYNLQVNGFNPNNPSQHSRSNLNLMITVLDVLDSGPLLVGPSIAYVRENYPTYSKVAQIQSSNLARPVYYNIIDGNQLNHFLIEPLTGTVRTTISLDREDIASYQLTIQGSFAQGFESNFELSVNVADINDGVPSFFSSFFSFQVPENSISNQSLGNLVINDPDQNQNAMISSFVITNAFAASFFSFNLYGNLFLNEHQKLDRENKFSTMDFEIYAVDAGVPTQLSKVSIHIDVTDANDPPHFDNTDYEFTLSTPLLVDIPQFRVQAVDPDIGSNGNLYYSLSDTGAEGIFSIHPTTGNISVINNAMLKRKYSLILIVTDGGGLEASANINIFVETCNFKNLTFSRSNLSISMRLIENITIGSIVVGSGEFHVLDLNQQNNQMQADVEFSLQLSTTFFTINSQTGEITVVDLDREVQQVHHFVVQAMDRTDPSRIAQAEVMVTVLDINDNHPEFLSTLYSGSIAKEDLMVSGLPYNVLRVCATDLDEGSNSEITYSLTQPSTLFSVEHDTGFVRADTLLDDIKTDTTFQFLVRATDAGTPPLSGTTTVTIIVYSKTPQFMQSVYSIQVSEDTLSNTPIFNVTTVDSLETGPISLRFSGSQIGIPFSLSDDGTITLIDPGVDYETRINYNLTLRALNIEAGLDGFATFLVEVLDYNDEFPTFDSNGLYVATASENTMIGMSILQVKAVDRDSLPNAEITYYLDRNDSDLFMIDQMGNISLNGTLDFETMSGYEFVIYAEDSGSPSLLGTAVVRLHIENINDNPPIFRQTLYSTSIQSMDSAGPIDLFVSATDPDKPEGIIYGVVQGIGSNDFMISENGQIHLVPTNPTLPEYMLNISAFDGVFYGYAMLHISIVGLNTDPPRFNATSYTASVLENSSAGVFIAQLLATDVDLGINGNILYSLQNYQNFFSIESETGRITTNAGAVNIDRESNRILSVLVLATDGGFLTSLAQLLVSVSDINDNHPVFDRSVFKGFTLHNMHNDEILTIRASDQDTGNNSQLTFNFADLDVVNSLPFRIHSDTGVVYTITPPQEDIQAQYEFNVTVQDNGFPPLISVSLAHVVIHITPGDSGLLKFEQNEYSTTITEDITFGTVVIMGIALAEGNVTVVDCNPFSLSEEDNPFILVANSHILVRSTSISPRNYTFFIFAECLLTSVITTSSIIRVQVLAVNHPPELKLQYMASVRENATNLPSVIMVTPNLEATDSDSPDIEDGIIEYRLTDHTNLFSINRDTGLLLLEQPLDFEVQKFYDVGVEAYDLGIPRLSDLTIIRIMVLDIDDNPPVFNQSTYFEEVSEHEPIGTLIHTSIVDDRDEVSSYLYTISGDVFAINSKSGEIRLLQQLDREATTNYTVEIVVRDNNGRATTSLTVTVLDSNDHSPVFNQSEYRVNIKENFPVGVCFLQVFASDDDEGENAVVVYKPGNNFTNNRINVNYTTGEILFKESPDHEISSQFTLHILATDIFDEMRTFVSVIVTLEDMNDNTPVFSLSSYTARISENRPVGSTVEINLVDRIEAVDADSGVRGSLTYSIADHDADYFSFSGGDIISRVIFDREKTSSFNITVVVTDMGSPPLSTNVSVQVQISDQNDNYPEFPMSIYSINISESIKVGSLIFTEAAMDADFEHNGRIGFYSITGTHSRDFKGTTNDDGSLSIFVEAILDHENEQRRTYQLNLTAFDNGFMNSFVTRQGSALLIVNVTNEDDNSAVFTQQIYTATVPENISVGIPIVSVLAMDIDQTQLLYSIQNADSNPEIGINTRTGAIFAVQSLDFEGKNFYILEVTVTGGIDLALVRITITNVNDIPPHFLNENLTVNITENNRENATLVQLPAEDVDSNNFRISYQIVSGNVGGIFNITSRGTVLVKGILDREAQAFYNLTVMAEDNDFPSLTSTTNLLINVIDVNDNAAMDGHQDVLLFLLEGRISEISLGKVFVNDSDIINEYTYEPSPISETDIIVIGSDGSIHINTPTPPAGMFSFLVAVRELSNTPIQTIINVFIINVTQSATDNSLTLQLSAITPGVFADNHFGAFFVSSSDILRRELFNEVDIQILSIQPSLSSSTDTDVTFSVMNRTSGSYITPQLVQYTLHVHRHELQTKSLNLTIFTESVDLCSIERCSIATSCINLYQHSLSDTALGTNSFTYLGIYRNHSFSCDEPPASLCNYIACPSPARCILSSGEGGAFKAECLTNCGSQPCQNGGICFDQNPGYFCLCQNGYEGRDCKQTEASFLGNSYAIFPNLQGHPSGRISFEFNAKNSSDSHLLYSGRFDTKTSDFVHVELMDRRVCVNISYGGANLRDCVKSWKSLGDGLWHRITIEYTTTVSIIIYIYILLLL